MRTTLALIAALLTTLFVVGCESKIDDDHYARITQGMSEDDVTAILGSGEDETTSGFSISGGGVPGSKDTKVTVVRYKDTRNNRAIVVTYHGHKVHEATKVGF